MHKWALACCYFLRIPCYYSRCLYEGNFSPQMWLLRRLVGKWWAMQVDWIYPRRLSIFVVDFLSSELKRLRWISIMWNRWSDEVREINVHAGIKSNFEKITRVNKVFSICESRWSLTFLRLLFTAALIKRSLPRTSLYLALKSLFFLNTFLTCQRNYTLIRFLKISLGEKDNCCPIISSPKENKVLKWSAQTVLRFAYINSAFSLELVYERVQGRF